MKQHNKRKEQQFGLCGQQKDMKKFLKEFKQFAVRGNVMDMAVGVVIGSAFTAIVTSLVNDIISPLVGLLVKTDFKDLVIQVGNVAIAYGSFLNAVVNFLIVALVLFCIIRAINRMHEIGHKGKEEPAPAETKICPYCQSEISVKATRGPHCTSQLE